MKKLISLAVLGFGLFALWKGYRFSSDGLVLSLSERQIQEQLNKRFPIEKNYLISTISLTDPKVALRSGTNRIHFGVVITATIPTQTPVQGSGEFSGEIRYDPQTEDIYLTEVGVERLEIPKLGDKVTAQVKEVSSLLAREALSRFPIYRLSESDFRVNLSLLEVKSVRVAGRRVEIAFGIKSK